jgi:ferritin-like metal-binding protein YciE
MANSAASRDLRAAFRDQLIDTQAQILRLNEVFRVLGEFPDGKNKCRGMEGLIAETEEVLDDVDEPELQDMALIASAQRVEHYEISAYHTVSSFAHALGEDQVVILLQKTLHDEQKIDNLFSRLAESHLDLENDGLRESAG